MWLCTQVTASLALKPVFTVFTVFTLKHLEMFLGQYRIAPSLLYQQVHWPQQTQNVCGHAHPSRPQHTLMQAQFLFDVLS